MVKRGPRRLSTFAAILATGLVCLFMGGGFVAANANLHQRLHNESHGATGPCLLCLLVKGLVESPAPAPPVPVVSGVVACALPVAGVVTAADEDFLLLPSRAPPGPASSPPDAA